VPKGGAKVYFSGYSSHCQAREGQKPIFAACCNCLKLHCERLWFGVGQNQVK
jgi:hypothetical protein